MLNRRLRNTLITGLTGLTLLTGTTTPAQAAPINNPRDTIASIASFISATIANGSIQNGPVNGAPAATNDQKITSSQNGDVTLPAGYTATWNSDQGTFCVDNSGTNETEKYYYSHKTGAVATGTCANGSTPQKPNPEDRIFNIASFIATHMADRALPNTGVINQTHPGDRATYLTVNPLSRIKIPAGYYVAWNQKTNSLCIDNSGTKETHYAWGIRNIHDPVERPTMGRCYHRPITRNTPLIRTSH